MGRRAKEVTKKEYNALILVKVVLTKKLVTYSPDDSILDVMESFAKTIFPEVLYWMTTDF